MFVNFVVLVHSVQCLVCIFLLLCIYTVFFKMSYLTQNSQVDRPMAILLKIKIHSFIHFISHI